MSQDTLTEEILQRLADNQRVRRELPWGGRVHIDRQLPFLCIYRQPEDRVDAGTRDLIQGEASFIATTAVKSARTQLAQLVRAIAEHMSSRFGAFLILEVWSAPDTSVALAADQDDVRPTELQPNFEVITRRTDSAQRTLETLRRHLLRVRILRQSATADVNKGKSAHPPGMTDLLKQQQCRSLNTEVVGICVRPIYRDHATGEVFPSILHTLKRGFGRALKRAFFTFSRTRTNSAPRHYESLGRRAFVKAVRDVDRRLSEISDSFDFLLHVTPVNSEGAWREFRRSRFQTVPHFYYRPLAAEPSVMKRQLFDVPIEKIEDPTLADLFRQRQDELDRRITMLTDIGTRRFLLGSRQVYGDVNPELLAAARQLLNELPPRSRADAGPRLTATQFADAAQQEIRFYQEQMPAFTAQVEVREDLFSGLLCSGGNLLIGHQTMIPDRRVQALLQHEVGTHLLTYYNGLNTSFQQLHSGFAGYDALQEGLAVLTEYLVGGLSYPRLRLLAARVIAADMLIQGATFVETFRTIDIDFGFSQRVAYTITMRTYRGGGLTKDAVYLRGLVEILQYLRSGGELEPLFVGKFAAEHIPLIQELRHRNVLEPPVLRPRYLNMPAVAERLEAARNTTSVLELAQGKLK